MNRHTYNSPGSISPTTIPIPDSRFPIPDSNPTLGPNRIPKPSRCLIPSVF